MGTLEQMERWYTNLPMMKIFAIDAVSDITLVASFDRGMKECQFLLLNASGWMNRRVVLHFSADSGRYIVKVGVYI